MNSNHSSLAGLDLNLLTGLQALLYCRSVSDAAAMTGRTQSAMSHTLARLRHHFNDPLLVRDGWKMRLTPFAEALAPKCEETAQAVAALFRGQEPFDPATSRRQIRIATRDIAAPLFSSLVRRIAEEAPGISINFTEAEGIRSAVQSSEAEIGLVFGTPKPDVALQNISLDPLTWAVFAPEGHAYTQNASLATWAGAQHITVAGKGKGPVEIALAQTGQTRRVLCSTTGFTAALTLASECGALFTTLREPFEGLATRLGLQALPPPFALPDAPVTLILRTSFGDPFATWLAGICVGTVGK